MSLKKSWTIFTAILFLFIHYAISEAPVFSDQDCLECHGKPNLSQILSNGTTRSLYVNPEEWSQDIHHLSQMTCLDCHVNANPYLHFREGYIDVNCESCHRAETEEFRRNVHFEYSPLSSERELPQCYHCHTRHFILKLDNPLSSVSEKNIEDTCGTCHAEVMVRSLLNGSSLGKISGHRKGDISERFDMKVCIHCHNPAHSSTGVAKDFCARCHDVKKKANMLMGPTHLSSKKWMKLNYLGGGLAVFLLLGTVVLAGYRSRKGILTKCQIWLKSMEKEEQEQPESDAPDVPKETAEPTEVSEQTEPTKPEQTTEPKLAPDSEEEEPE
ncbi:hypothetical protein ACFLT2_02535 [Acidobacteriota bacterium]